MKGKGIFTSRSFWSLFIINVAIIIYYLKNHTGFRTLVWIYWCQSVLIGFFTFLDLVTMKRIKPGTMKINNEPMDDPSQAKGCLAPFFAVHFGFFHFGYFIFIFTITDLHEYFDWNLFEVSVGAFALDQVWNFIRVKQWEQSHEANPGIIFFLPYARVIPMHLTIMLPQFIGAISQLGLFLVLKMFADLLMSVIVTKYYGKQEEVDPTVLRMVK